MLAAHLRRTSRTCPARCPGCRCRSSEPAVIWPNIIRPWRSSSLKCSQVAQCGTRFEFAMQHARRILVRAEHADRLAGLDQQRLVGVERAQRLDDAIEAFPVARRAADAAVDDQLVRILRDLGVEIVHQHAQRRFGQPALRCALRAARRAYGACAVSAVFYGSVLRAFISVPKFCAWRACSRRRSQFRRNAALPAPASGPRP